MDELWGGQYELEISPIFYLWDCITVYNMMWELYAMLKIRKNIYSSHVQVTFERYDNFRCVQDLYSKWNYIY